MDLPHLLTLFDSEGLGVLETHKRSSAYHQPPGFQKTVECVKEQQQITQRDRTGPAVVGKHSEWD